MLKSEVHDLFQKYLHRNPTKEEYKRFGAYDFEELESEISVCNERKSILENPRIAVLVSGHPRTLKIIESLKRFGHRNIDVFIFSWDQWGHRHTEADLTLGIDRYNIERTIRAIPGVKAYKIESNEEFVKNNDNWDIKYINWIRHPEVYVKSQLYAVAKSYELMEKYIQETGTGYSLVIKCRFENYLERMDINPEFINDVNNHKLIFTPDGREHSHPFPSYCATCQKAYELGYRHMHLFEHTNPICDVYAYGSVPAMKKYCSLFYEYDNLCRKFEDHNVKMMEILKTPHTKRGEAYIIEKTNETHAETEFFYFSSYPERLLSYMLNDYMLLKAKNVTLGWQP